MWVPFPSNSDEDADDVSALGNSVDGGHSVTSARDSMASSMDGGPSLARGDDGLQCARGVSRDSVFKGGGRYHLINQLAITSPSREKGIDGAGMYVDGKGGGGEGGDRRSPLRLREGKTPQRLDRGDGISGGRNTKSRTASSSPKPGTATMPTTSTRPRRPVAASQSDPPPRVAVGPTVLVVDKWQRPEGGDTGEAADGDTPMPAYCGTSTVKAREVSPSRSSTEARSAPSSEAKATEINFQVHGGSLRSTPTSSSSSVSTVVVGDDARYRLASPVTERVE